MGESQLAGTQLHTSTAGEASKEVKRLQVGAGKHF